MPEQFKPENNVYGFTYTITVRNTGAVTAQVISRHWDIACALGHIGEA